MYINIPKESQNVDKRCTFSSLVSMQLQPFILYAMNDKSKTTLIVSDLICWASYHTRPAAVMC